jgi:hypothetical protein
MTATAKTLAIRRCFLAGARRGGEVSGIPGHGAARAVLTAGPGATG